MMNGYTMGYGGLWTWVFVVLAIVAIAAFVKYRRK